MWRIYLGKMMNLSVTVLINLEMMSNSTWIVGTNVITFNQDLTGTAAFDCREDSFASTFFKQVIIAFVVKIVADFVLTGLFWLWGLIKGSKSWKDEYELAGEIVDLLFF